MTVTVFIIVAAFLLLNVSNVGLLETVIFFSLEV